MQKIKVKKIIILCVVSIFLALCAAFVWTGRFWNIANFQSNLKNLKTLTMFNRAYILFLGFVFCGLHLIIPIKKMYNWMFDRRWLIGMAVLVFMTVNKYHGVSIGFYNNVIQPEQGSELAAPIIGRTRAIRSDEFVVGFSSTLASSYGENAFGKYNTIMRAEETLNATNGVYLGISTIANAPQKLVYAILPVEYAFSFCWSFWLILPFLITLELFYIITKNKRLLSTAGAFLVIFSSFNLWWGMPSQLLTAPGTIVSIYYFLQSKERWKKILLGITTAVCFSMFVSNLYPAWQVPFGYMFLAIGIWVLHDNWDKVKGLKKSDWIIIGGALVLAVGLVLSYLHSISEYTEVITETVYPGRRVDTGYFYLSKLFYCAQAPFYAYKDVLNPSEAGVFFGVFPIPTIMAVFCWIKEKKKDWLTAGLLLAQIPMLLYVTVGFPENIAKLLLFSNSTVFRTIDIIGLIQIYFIMIVLGRYENTKKLPLILAIPVGMLVSCINLYFSNRDYPEYLSQWQSIVMFIVIAGLCVALMINLKDRLKNVWLVAVIGLSIFTGIYVFPIMKGFDAIFSKPVAQEIQKICEKQPDAKWITSGGGIVLSGYNVACGAPTVNSVNTYPNMKLWKKLDENSQYEDIYNRYAHIDVEFTSEETSFELIQGDYMKINLSYKDIAKTEAEYLLTMQEQKIEKNPYVEFEVIYEAKHMYIYHMIYK